jgi:predicted polyphosphate/ATP-dependent NAD kinase
MRSDHRRRIGLIVNPIAGMGGSVGLKGTDGLEILAEARRRGAVPLSRQRTERALARLFDLRHRFDLIAAAGPMGQDPAQAAGFAPEVLEADAEASGPEHTRAAARSMAGRGCGLILFAGGDGTARDVHQGCGGSVPMLGIPTGVKMHSAVFAVSPEAAGSLAALVAANGGRRIDFRFSEIMDVDENAVRAGRPAARLYGYVSVPCERGLVQTAKAGAPPEDDDAIDAAAREIARSLRHGIGYVIGPGRSAKSVVAALGLESPLLGVDLVLDRKLVGSDLGEAELMRLAAGRPVSVIVGVTGGQGFIFGRGNQPISPALIRQAGRDGLIVLAGPRKLAGLAQRRLLVETGDRALDRMLEGYLRVVTGPGRQAVMRAAAA